MDAAQDDRQVPDPPHRADDDHSAATADPAQFVQQKTPPAVFLSENGRQAAEGHPDHRQEERRRQHERAEIVADGNAVDNAAATEELAEPKEQVEPRLQQAKDDDATDQFHAEARVPDPQSG